MAYTSDEVNQAVERIVRTSIRFNYDSLGVRQVGTTFNDLQDAAAGLFLSFPNAAYYVAYLGTLRIKDLIDTEEALIGELVAAIRAVGRNVKPIKKLSFLNNAKVALDALSTATGQRASAFLDIEEVPAYKRFDNNTQKFLNTESKNVLENGDIVATPQQARNELADLVESLQERHALLVEKVTYLHNAIDDYESLDIPERLSRDIINNARDSLQECIEVLEELTPEERLEQIRQVTLDILATRAAVKGFGALSPQGLFFILSGFGAPYTSTTYPGTPASLASDIAGPYAIFPGQDKLKLLIDGTDNIELSLPGSFVPFLQAVGGSPYTIDVGANEFSIGLTGYPDVNVTLTTGIGFLPHTLVNDINTAVTTQPIVAYVDNLPITTVQAVEVDVTGSGGDFDLVLPAALGVTWADLGVAIGQADQVVINDESSANYGLGGSISAVISGTRLEMTQNFGPIPSDEASAIAQFGTLDSLTFAVKVATASSQTALDNQWELSFNDIEDGTLGNLGIYPGSVVRARKTTAEQLEEYINTNASASLSGVARIQAESTFVETVSTAGRTVPTSVNSFVVYALRARGDITVGGTAVTFVLPDLNGELNINDLIIIRETSISGDVDEVGTITGVSGTTVTATFANSISTATNVLIEGGPDPASYVDLTLSIDTGGPQDGEYPIESVSGLDLTLGTILPTVADLGGQPFFFTSVSIGSTRLDLISTDTSLVSEIEVQSTTDDVSGQFFTTVPKSAVGTTAYFQLPETPKNLEPGDQVEVYNTDAVSPDVERVIKRVLGNSIIEFETPIDVDQVSVDFTISVGIPFGRVRKRVKQNFAEMAALLDTWLKRYTDTDLLNFFRKLDGYVNVLTVSNNPTLAQVNDAVFHVQSLLGKLTISGAATTGDDPAATLESALDTYSADIVAPVDDLLAAYEQKGATRAKNILLEGRFSDFFGLDKETSTYSGNAQRTLREVVRNDLPVRKTSRLENRGDILEEEIASWEDVDFEYKAEDTDPFDDVDIPAEGDLVPNVPVP